MTDDVPTSADDKKKARWRKYYEENRDTIIARSAKWIADNKDRKRATDKAYAATHKEQIADNLRRWLERNPDGRKRWRDANPNYGKEWKAANPEKVKAYTKITYARQRSNPKTKLESSIRSGIVKGIAKGSKSSRRTFEILGYSLADLMSHLESKFLPGMTWENYGKDGWHVDHIIPLAVHNYASPDDIDFGRAWALTNLQPLWQADNISKHAKIDEPFQPSFVFSVPAAANDNDEGQGRGGLTSGAAA